MTEIGAFMVRPKLASEFEFPAPILQGRTIRKESKYKKFIYFEDIGPLCKKQKLKAKACDWSQKLHYQGQRKGVAEGTNAPSIFEKLHH